jgi:hypothetical protein
MRTGTLAEVALFCEFRAHDESSVRFAESPLCRKNWGALDGG